MTTKVYRGRHEIVTQILQTIMGSGLEGASRTSVMYKSFLSCAHLKEYTSFLVEKDLIEEFLRPIKGSGSGNEKLVYKITEKGLRLLRIYQEIKSSNRSGLTI